ncbi:hypothetical protein R8Z57_14625 [Microbacterium sp. M3]|uniref:DUF222 domain-containing protein n=1 Tax=Microbacterium arthrosphaerae TaxID=792652 RepID=A0ABU4H5L2_9MICO|nr:MULTISPECIES: DUF6507 family protein [Microbacterium]MDW4574012.1 hypothetical protein [Microbacterium arthrosphaerae]MDW7607867.1 hypothetical protein [Microbacterium sp. M3]
MTDSWSVDPDRVIGVLAGVDDEGVELAEAAAAMDRLAASGATLSVDGRTTLSQAWEAFLDERRLVPGKLMHTLAMSAQALTEATTAVVAGDARMMSDGRDAEARALDEWGIDSPNAYGGGML